MRLIQILEVLLIAAMCSAPGCDSGDGGQEKPSTDTEQGITDPSVGCPSATELEVGAEGGVDGTIFRPGAVEFYSVSVESEAMIHFATSSAAVSSEDGVLFDPVIVLYNGDGTERLASSNDALLEGLVPSMRAQDAAIFYNVLVASTLCVAVEDVSSWIGGTEPNDSEDFAFTITASDATSMDGVVLESASNDTLETATELDVVTGATSELSQGVACGILESATDVDVFYLDTKLAESLVVSGFLEAAGPGVSGSEAKSGSGSTLYETRFSRLQGSTGNRYSSVVLSESGWMQSPSNESRVYLSVELEEGASLGGNAFYCLHYTVELASNVWTTVEDTSSKEDITTAQVLEALNTNGATLLKGNLGDGLEVDYYRFDVAAPGDQLEVICGAATMGSGLEGASFVIEDSTGATLRSATESNGLIEWGQDYDVGPLTLADSGPHHLVVLHTGQHPLIVGAHYSCRLSFL